MSEQGKGDMEERIEKLSEEKRDLEQQVSNGVNWIVGLISYSSL